MDETIDPLFLESLKRKAEAALAEKFGSAVRLGEAELLKGPGGRSTVFRCRVDDGPTDAPESVIVKCARGSQGQAYELGDLSGGGPSARNISEWAGVVFLDRLNVSPPLSVGFLGGDRAEGLVLLEDLGEGESLADRLTGDDPGKAEEALFTYAQGMGRLHAATAGREADYLELRRSLGDTAPGSGPRLEKWSARTYEGLAEAAQLLGFSLPAGLGEELGDVEAEIGVPGPFLAYAPGDTCPDNHRLTDDGIRFFDFEFSGFRHALLDGTYMQVPFPTCWCVNRLPDGMPSRLLEAYRAELVNGCPEAGEDARFHRAALSAHAFWMIDTLGGSVRDSLEEDHVWGISSIRQRQLLRLDLFADAVENGSEYPALGATAREMAFRLRERWPDLEEMPLYPAFR